jgi:hypothetical protein
MACGTHPAASTASPQASTIVAGAPLATSISTAVGSWAIVPMGDLGQPLNTFWQLFFRPLGSSRWSDKAEGLAVATNGGLVMAAPDGKSAVVGVRSAANLNFSPILTTVNDGRSWSPGPPVSGLASEPDALAVDSQGQGLALTSGGTSGGGVLASSAGLLNWRPIATAKGLGSSPAGSTCGVVAITAVAFVGTRPVVGADCRHSGVVGIFTGPAGGWHMSTPTLPASLDRGSVAVLALRPTRTGLCALLGVSVGHGTALMVAWATGAGLTWTLSPVLAIGADQLMSVGPDGPLGLFVLLSASSASESVDVLSAPGSSWRLLPSPPARTATMVLGSAGTMDALVVDRTLFTDWQLAPGSDSWSKTQVINVPIQFGSSS